jgi:hypothetical protein
MVAGCCEHGDERSGFGAGEVVQLVWHRGGEGGKSCMIVHVIDRAVAAIFSLYC